MELFNVIEIETVNLCTRRCSYCKFGQDRRDAKVQWLSDELLEKIADNLGDLNFHGRISPYCINEPLIDKRMPEIIRRFRSHCPQALITLESNGDPLTPKLLETLMEAGLDGLGFSIYDKKTLKKLSPYWRNPKVRFLDMRTCGWENRGGEVRTITSEPRINRKCRRPFHMIVIKPSGDVALCCSDMYGDVVMGNVADRRLEEIWRGELFSLYRSRLTSGSRKGLKLCESCSYDGSGNPLDFPLHKSRSHLRFLARHLFMTLTASFPKVRSAFKRIQKVINF